MKKIRMYVISPKTKALHLGSALLFILGFLVSPLFYSLEITSLPAIFTADGGTGFPSHFAIASTVLPLYDVPLPKEQKQDSLPVQPTAEPFTITKAPANRYTPSQGIYVQNDTSYSFDIDTLLTSPVRLSKDKSVLIYHTHTSEAYTPSEKYTYTQSDPYRSENPDYNMVLVGKEIADHLRKKGINVIHDTTCHDFPSYSGSYDRSLATIEKNMAENSSIGLVLDIHRDAIAGDDGKYLKTYMPDSNPPCAQALIVIGTDEGGLNHPGWQENLKLGLSLQQIMKNTYSSLARPLHLRTERFNGHASNGALLLEIGSNGNTMEEALNCARLVADCITRLFQ